MKVQLSKSAVPQTTKAFTDVCYVDVDMAQIEVDGTVAISPSTPESKHSLKQLKACHVVSVVINQYGPGGGTPEVRLFGNRADLVKYLTKYYGDPDAVSRIKKLLK